MARLNECIEKTGIAIRAVSGDVSKKPDVVACLDDVENSTTCKAVLHLAGVVGDGRIENLTWEQFSAVIGPKVAGSMHLHEHALEIELPLDHFVMFSSIYGLLGYRELSHYAAANAFQDGLAHYRKSINQPALAVSWGTWSSAGMAYSFGKGFETYWKSQGMDFVPVDAGMATLGALLETALSTPHVAVLPARWNDYIRSRPARKPHHLMRLLCETRPTKPTSASSNALPAVLSKTAVIVKAALGVQEIDDNSPLAEQGLTSMQLVDITSELNAAFAVTLAPTALFEHPSVHSLSGHLADLCGISNIRPSLPELPAGEDTTALKQDVTHTVKTVLSRDTIDTSQPIAEQGMTSMTVVSLTEKLQEKFNVAMSDTILLVPYHRFDCRVLGSFTARYLSNICAQGRCQITVHDYAQFPHTTRIKCSSRGGRYRFQLRYCFSGTQLMHSWVGKCARACHVSDKCSAAARQWLFSEANR